MRSEERSVVGNYVSTAEVRLTTQTGPSHPHPGVGGVSNASTAECHARRRIQTPGRAPQPVPCRLFCLGSKVGLG
ncbi:MAG: hypothetical protein GX934_16425 [Burkholderiales bacterium]|nr:hypothetical protein [Burkholderiales bacterium]